MSDGITEARRSMRKGQYLNSIELKKDELFDYYIECTNKLINTAQKINFFSKNNKTVFGKNKPDYHSLSLLEKDLLVVTTQLNETQKLINKLDLSYKEALEKPSSEF